MPMFTINIIDMNNHITIESRHHGEDSWEATRKAVQKRWGKKAHFQRNNGISVGRSPFQGTQYGQITTPIKKKPGSHNCITGTISIVASRS